MIVRFTNTCAAIDTVFDGPVTIPQLASEPNLFSCDYSFARRVCGPLGKQILDSIDKVAPFMLGTEVIDLRVQRLMPGMFPSIPGWHCDGVPRDDYYAQPDFSKADTSPRHLCLVLSTEEDGVSRTEFSGHEFFMEVRKDGFAYKQLHEHIEEHQICRWKIEQGKLYRFTQFDPHRATAATTRGWRMFFRMSLYHKPPIANAIPSQQQVYVLSEANGW